MSQPVVAIAREYYQNFNQRNREGMIALLHEEIRHEPNQSDVPRTGIPKFREFLEIMDDHYDETLIDLVFFTEDQNSRVAVEFTVQGIYKKSADGLPPANGQKYTLPAAAFLEFQDNKIIRITTYYNLTQWIELVS